MVRPPERLKRGTPDQEEEEREWAAHGYNRSGTVPVCRAAWMTTRGLAGPGATPSLTKPRPDATLRTEAAP